MKATKHAGIDPKFFNEVSQFAHFGVAAVVFLTVFVGLARFHHWSWLHMLPFLIAGVALAAWKEFWHDKHDENADTRGSDLEDFSFYMLGIAYACLLIKILP